MNAQELRSMFRFGIVSLHLIFIYNFIVLHWISYYSRAIFPKHTKFVKLVIQNVFTCFLYVNVCTCILKVQIPKTSLILSDCYLFFIFYIIYMLKKVKSSFLFSNF